jgi:serine/threonine protein phosphatase PrpC
MNRIIIPTITKRGFVEKAKPATNLIVGSTVGLVKSINEDSIGCLLNDNYIRVCVADGHWGKKAAEIIVDHWMKEGLIFPTNNKEAISEVIKIEKKLFKLFGKTNMDPNSDFTPEASFIATQLVGKTLIVVSYGDCRLLTANKGKIKTKLATKETWLGAFSQLGSRNRISVDNGLVFEKVILQENDTVLIFSDGIDQCVYERNTLSDEFLANLTNKETVENTLNSIFSAVFTAGAEDNASLVVLKN